MIDDAQKPMDRCCDNGMFGESHECQKQKPDATPREWFAVKRTKSSQNYQFYPPNKNNRKSIEAIAPDGGNFEEIELIEKSIYDALKQRVAELELKLADAEMHYAWPLIKELEAAKAEIEIHAIDSIDKAALLAERNALSARIAELEARGSADLVSEKYRLREELAAAKARVVEAERNADSKISVFYAVKLQHAEEKLTAANAEIEEINQEGAELYIALDKQLTQANAEIERLNNLIKLMPILENEKLTQANARIAELEAEQYKFNINGVRIVQKQTIKNLEQREQKLVAALELAVHYLASPRNEYDVEQMDVVKAALAEHKGGG